MRLRTTLMLNVIASLPGRKCVSKEPCIFQQGKLDVAVDQRDVKTIPFMLLILIPGIVY